jgi:hypothetical protein
MQTRVLAAMSRLRSPGRSRRHFIAIAIAAACCGFFEELESLESAEAGETDGSDTDAAPTEGEPGCSFPEDDRCGAQDRLHACDPQTEVPSTWDCASLCGALVNFTCLGVGNGQHACWCVEPGAQKVLSCKELEGCLRGCEGAPDLGCADQCFGRTTTGTVRTLGALVHCVHSSCHEICTGDPNACASCIETGMSGAGDCVLERTVCDNDRNDEPEWPY